MTQDEQEELLKMTQDFLQGQGICLVCKLNMWKAIPDKQVSPECCELSSPCQQCQNHILEKYLRALRQGNQ